MTEAPGRAEPLLDVAGLGVRFRERGAVQDAAFGIARGEILGVVGESGSGKTVAMKALIGLLPKTAGIRGAMHFADERFDLARPDDLAPLRGARISMIFQDPMSALDPLMTVARHLALRGVRDPSALLRMAGLDRPEPLLEAYPHRLSGGQCQRVAIACALAGEPDLLIADEPTTALDVTVQAEILERIRTLAAARGMAVILVTHDLAVVRQLCARVLVMRQGAIVEQGGVAAVLERPTHDYTKALLRSIPRPSRRGQRLSAPEPTPIAEASARNGAPLGETVLDVGAIGVRYDTDHGPFDAARAISFSMRRGEILGLVGESGSGKSTVAKALVGLAPAWTGRIDLMGEELDWRRPERHWRRRAQYIFQDPRGALDPTARILAQVRAPLDIHAIGAPAEREERAARLLDEVGLEREFHFRKPGSLSGGQRQRATIARALALEPDLLICDESVSALDVSIQARVLDLLMDLRAERGLAILFITHDLRVVRHIADAIMVMRRGEIVEQGPADAVFARPREDYTKRLLAAVPVLPEGGSEPEGAEDLR